MLATPGYIAMHRDTPHVAKPERDRLPKVLNQASARRFLEENGWTATQGGKRVKMTKEGHRPITLSHHRGGDYPQGLTDAILRQAGLKGGGER